MKYALEFEEVEHLHAIIKRLDDGDAALIMTLHERLCLATGEVEGMKQAIALFTENGKEE